MTTSAQFVHRGALHSPQHRQGIRFRIAHMLRCAPVARLAANSPLSDLRLSLGIEGEGPVEWHSKHASIPRAASPILYNTPAASASDEGFTRSCPGVKPCCFVAV